MVLFLNGIPAITPRNKKQDESGGGGANNFLTDLAFAYEFETGALTTDATGNFNLTDVNTVGQTAGVIGQAADFEGSNNEHLFYSPASASEDICFGNIDYTIAFWFRLESLIALQFVVTKHSPSNTGAEYMIYMVNTTLRFLIRDTGNNAVVADITGLTTGVTYFVVAMHNSATNEMILRLDDSTEVTASVTAKSPGTINFTVGSRDGGNASRTMDGWVDQLYGWRRLLTPDEVTDLYNAGNGRAYSYFT